MTSRLPRDQYRGAMFPCRAIIDLQPGAALRCIASLAARWYSVPIALTHLRDGRFRWLQPAWGVDGNWTEREISICAESFAADEILVVPDTQADQRFRENPLATGPAGVRFYAGIPLRGADDGMLGTLCIADRRPRDIRAGQLDALRELAELAENELRTWLSLAAELENHVAFDAGERRYRELFENATDIVFTHDLAGRFTAVNRAAERITGYSRDELLALNTTDLVSPAHREVVQQMVLEQFGGGVSHSHELELLGKDGRVIELEVSTHLLFERGQPVGLMGFGRDITARKREETARRRAEEKLCDAVSELARFSSHLEQLHRLGAESYERREDLFSEYLRAGCGIFGVSTGIIAQVEHGTCVIRALQSGADALPADFEVVLEETRFARILTERKTRHYSLKKPCKRDPIYGKRGAAFFLGTPILVGGRLYGALCFASRNPAVPPGLRQQEIVELMARGIGRFLLEKEMEAERNRATLLEQDRTLVLETVARRLSLGESLSHLILMIERQQPGLKCAVLLARDNRFSVVVAPSLPEFYTGCVKGLRVGPAGAFCGSDEYWVDGSRAGDALGPPSWTAHTELMRELKLAVCGSSPITSAAGETRGVFAMYRSRSVPLALCRPDLLRMASRLAAIAIEQRQLTDRLAHMAQHDSLTGLLNRRSATDLLERAIQVARDGQRHVAVVFIDLDRFKQVNDTLGHPAGDLLLQQVGARLQACVRDKDGVGRIWGDEFTAILTDLGSAGEGRRLLRRLVDAIRKPFTQDGQELFITASFGVSLYPRDGTDALTLLRKADSALSRAKKGGKDTLAFFTAERRAARFEPLELENYLYRALERGEFQLRFQPQIKLDGALDGLEALLSWRHPVLGRVPAGQFIPVAEESGIIVPIGEWVLAEACRRNVGWHKAGYPRVKVAVNVSAVQLAQPDFVDVVARTLSESGLGPHFLELEVTESGVMRNVKWSSRTMARLRELGVSISIDDFGTGYSSLSYLRNLPLDTLKIDRSFLRGAESPEAALPFIHAIVSLAHEMGLTVVGEGVESMEQLELLRLAGCDKLQGHLFARPLSAEGAGRLLKTRRKLLPLRRRH